MARLPSPTIRTAFAAVGLTSLLVLSAACMATRPAPAPGQATDDRGLGQAEIDLETAERGLRAALLGTGRDESAPDRRFAQPPPSPAAARTGSPPVDAAGASAAPPPSPPPEHGLPAAAPPAGVHKAARRESDGPGRRCAVACEALGSMGRAATRLCELTGVGDDRCQGARRRVQSARWLVETHCPACAR
jgi:hypothetical protein